MTLSMLKYPRRSIQTEIKRKNYRILYNEIKSGIKDKNAVICGDFNSPSVSWSTLTADREGTDY